MDELAPGLPSPDTAPSPAEQAFPLPPLMPTDMGLPAPPTRTIAPPVPVPQLDEKQKLLRLAALAAMIGGAGHPLGAAGLGQGVLAGQAQILKEQQDAITERQRQQTQLDRQYEQDQQTYQSATEQRQKDLQGAVRSVRASLLTAKTQADYDARVDGFANMLRSAGYRGVDANWVRQVQPFVKPSQAQRASDALDKIWSNPLTKAAMEKNPQGFLNGTVQFDANDDGTPETYTIQQLSVLAKRPLVTDDQGKPVVPDTKGEEIPADAFKAKLQSLTDVFVATNRRQPTAQEKDQLVDQARAFTQEKPAANTTAADSLLQRSYQYTNTQIEKLRQPVDQQVSNLTQAREELAQGTPASDALAIPKILSATSGGQGSGLRMNEAEIARIVGGRSNWESIKAWAQRWSRDPQKAGTLTPDQRQQLTAVIDAISQRATKKLDRITKAGTDLVGATDPLTHRRIFGDLQRDLSTLDTTPAAGGQQIGRFTVEVQP